MIVATLALPEAVGIIVGVDDALAQELAHFELSIDHCHRVAIHLWVSAGADRHRWRPYGTSVSPSADRLPPPHLPQTGEMARRLCAHPARQPPAAAAGQCVKL
jgi:hypothetical protein